MEWIHELNAKGLLLSDVQTEDLEVFIRIENLTHSKYIDEQKEFLGEYRESVIVDGFKLRQGMTCFKKIICDGKIIGFLGYNKKADRIDRVFIRIIPEFQNRGIGSLFLLYLKELSNEFQIPVEIVAIKTNPAKQLYMRMGFQFVKEQEAFCYFQYEPKQRETTS